MNRLAFNVIVLLVVAPCLFLNAQQILVDEMVEAASLNCFPVLGDSMTYYYLPAVGQLGEKENGWPEFSYLRYVLEKNSPISDKAIVKADGGAILHFLAEYTTSDQQIKKAESALKMKLNREIKLAGPVLFKEARYTIVSSILNKGKKERRVITTGDAPIFQNSKLAFSFELTPTDSKILLESFKMATPDISLIFEFSFAGLSHDFEGDITVNWDEFRSSRQFGASGSAYFVSAEIEAGFETLRKQHTIDVNIVGSNQYLEQVLNTAYNKLLTLVFEPVKPESIPRNQRGGLGGAIGELLGPSGALSSGNTIGFGLNASYRMKQLNLSGKSKLTFKGRETTQRKHYITFNIGDLYKRYGQNEQIFKDVSMEDITFLQRDVYVGIDGSLSSEFKKLINSVTVTLRKTHEDGTTTLKEINVNKETLAPEARFVLSYLNHQDKNLTDWRYYEYQTHWQFVGGGAFVSEWKTSSAAMINLYVPYKRKKIELLGSIETAACDSIRALSVKISYPFFGKIKTTSHTIKLLDQLNDKYFEITLPENEINIDCTITAFKINGALKNEQKKLKSAIIFVDDICEN